MKLAINFIKHLIIRTIPMSTLLLLNACSGNKASQASSTQIDKGNVPNSVFELKKISNQDSIEYTIGAHKASTDLINLGKGYLKTGNSGKALQMLALGFNLFPYRDDILQLKRTALESYVNVTNDMIKKKLENCSILQERLNFLYQVSPDNIKEVNPLSESCKNSTKYNSTKRTDNPFAIIDYPSPKPIPEYENKYKVDLSHDLKYSIWRKNHFPKFDIALYLLKYFGSFQFIPIKNNVDVNESGTYANLTSKYEFKTERESISGEDFCDELGNILNVESGHQYKCLYDFGSSGGEFSVLSVGSSANKHLHQIVDQQKMIVDLIINNKNGTQVKHSLILKVKFSPLRSHLFYASGKGEQLDPFNVEARESWNEDKGIRIEINTTKSNNKLTIYRIPVDEITNAKDFILKINSQKTYKYLIKLFDDNH